VILRRASIAPVIIGIAFFISGETRESRVSSLWLLPTVVAQWRIPRILVQIQLRDQYP
jgi:hypothetical protein